MLWSAVKMVVIVVVAVCVCAIIALQRFALTMMIYIL